MSTKAKKSEKPAETGNGAQSAFRIEEWAPVAISANHAYVVRDTAFNLGLLVVDGGSDSTDAVVRSLVIQAVNGRGEPAATYRDDAVVLPAELRKLIAQERLRRFAARIRGSLCESIDSSANPELALVAWCLTLEDGFAGDEMAYLLEDLAEHGENVGLDAGELDTLEAINAECAALWPDQAKLG